MKNNIIALPGAELKMALPGLAKLIGRHTTLPVLSAVRVARDNTGVITLQGKDLGQGTGQTSHHTVIFGVPAQEDFCVSGLGKELGSRWVLFLAIRCSLDSLQVFGRAEIGSACGHTQSRPDRESRLCWLGVDSEGRESPPSSCASPPTE